MLVVGLIEMLADEFEGGLSPGDIAVIAVLLGFLTLYGLILHRVLRNARRRRRAERRLRSGLCD